MKRTRFALLALCALLLPSVQGAIVVGEPDLATGDWYTYDGAEAMIQAELVAGWADDPDFIALDVVNQTQLRYEILADETVSIHAVDHECEVSSGNYWMNGTLRFEPGTTAYTGDVIDVSLHHELTRWTPEVDDRSGKERIRTHTTMVFNLSGEVNEVESEIIEVRETRGDVAWPRLFSAGETWTVDEEIDVERTTRTRENGGLWNETSIAWSADRSLHWEAIDEQVVHAGDRDSTAHDTVHIRGQLVGGNTTWEMWLAASGLTIKQSTTVNGTLIGSLTLADSELASREVREEIVTRGLPAPAFVAGLAVFALAATRRPRSAC